MRAEIKKLKTLEKNPYNKMLLLKRVMFGIHTSRNTDKNRDCTNHHSQDETGDVLQS